VLCVALAATLLRSSTPAPIAEGTWSPMAAAPIIARSLPASVWTGTEVVVVGGQAGNGKALRDGAAYNPATDTWRRLPDAPVDVPPGATATWTGREVVIVSARDEDLAETLAGIHSTSLPDPIALDPVGGTWRHLPDTDDWVLAGAALDGTLVTLVQRDAALFVAAYDESGGWRDIARLDAWDPHVIKVREFDALAAGGRVVFVSREWIALRGKPATIGFAVDPTTWTTSPIAGPPFEGLTPIVKANAALTDSGALVLLATTPDDRHRYSHVAATYDLTSSTWRSTKPLGRYPVESEFFTGLGTAGVDGHVVVLGGINSPSVIDKRKAGSLRSAYDVAEDRWHRLPAPGIDLERIGHSVVWTGRELVVWGGLHHRTGTSNRGDTPASDGAVYRLPS
jgi:hypothetical protein